MSFRPNSSQNVTFLSDVNSESEFRGLNPSSEIVKNSLKAKISAKYIYEQSTTDVSVAKDIRPQDSLRNLTCQLETSPTADKSLKPVNDVTYHNRWTECSFRIFDEFNNPLRSQKTEDHSSPKLPREIRNPLQASVPVPYTDERRRTGMSDAKDIKLQYSSQNFTCQFETPLTEDKSFKSVNDVVHHNQLNEFSSQILYEFNNPFCALETVDVSSHNPSRKIGNPLQTRIFEKYMPHVNQRSTNTKESNKYPQDTRPQYSLRNFTCKLVTLPKDKSFKPVNDVVYHNQWTECSYQIFDEFMNKPLHGQKAADVNIISGHVEYRDIKIKKDHLHFKMKCIQTGNISILIKIGNFTLIKDFYVSFNPCSSLLSDMTIEKINPVKDEFVFRLFIFDVFGEPVPSNSTATRKLYASFPSDDSEEVVDKVKHIEEKQVCYDITVRGNRPWSGNLIVLLNGEGVNHAQEFEFTDEECDAINDLDDEDYEWIQQFFEEGDCGIFIPLTTGNDDGKFVAYNEDDCKIQSQNAKDYQLICKDVRKRDILGEDFAHINNIKRVLEIKDFVEIDMSGSHAIIHLKNIKSHLRPKCKQVIQHLLRGLYYRRKASEAARIRMEWKNRLISIDEILLSSKQEQSFVLCKYFKEFFGNLLNQYNRKACDELFNFFNFNREGSEVDLHGLLVADEKKLESLRLNLLIGSLSPDQIEEILERCRIYSKRGRERQTFRKKFREGKVPEDLVRRFVRDGRFMNENSSDGSEHECFDEDCGLCFEDDDSEYYDDDLESLRSYGCKDDVDAIIRRCRKEGDEAIRKLKETLDKFDVEEAIFNGTPWLELIVGAGEHSRNNEQKIRPKVEKLLKERNLKFVPANKGSLVVTFKPYDGPEPCFGEYYCEKCNRCWKSSKSYIKKYQGCASCKAKCWPFKQREKGKVANYCREGSRSVKGQSLSHQSSLCQKCQELGRHCNEDDSYDSDY